MNDSMNIDPEVQAWIAAMRIAGIDPERARSLTIPLGSLADNEYIAGDVTFLERQPTAIVRDDDEDYPKRTTLSMGPKRPGMFFCFGDVSLFNKPSIFICGARDVSPKGIEIAYKCGRLAAEAGYIVASGYARGVDCAAHLGAFEAGGKTIALLPYGLSQFRVRRELAGAFDAESILAASELPPMFGFAAKGALRRNKILVSIAEAVIVIEPGETGGSWYSAIQASEQRRPLFFHPGERTENALRMEGLGGLLIVERDGAPLLDEVYRQCGR